MLQNGTMQGCFLCFARKNSKTTDKYSENAVLSQNNNPLSESFVWFLSGVYFICLFIMQNHSWPDESLPVDIIIHQHYTEINQSTPDLPHESQVHVLTFKQICRGSDGWEFCTGQLLVRQPFPD